jgi:hypothetical protein
VGIILVRTPTQVNATSYSRRFAGCSKPGESAQVVAASPSEGNLRGSNIQDDSQPKPIQHMRNRSCD